MSSWFIMTVFFRIKEIKVDDKEEFIQQGDGGGGAVTRTFFLSVFCNLFSISQEGWNQFGVNQPTFCVKMWLIVSF